MLIQIVSNKCNYRSNLVISQNINVTSSIYYRALHAN